MSSADKPTPSATAAGSDNTADTVEAAFYEAMQLARLDQLMACWDTETDVACIHPGGPRLMGLQAIRESFAMLFANGSVQAHPRHVRRVGGTAGSDMSVHNVLERVEVMTPQGPRQAYVIATNIFRRTSSGWRMVMQHASPGALDAQPTPMSGLDDDGQKPVLLH